MTSSTPRGKLLSNGPVQPGTELASVHPIFAFVLYVAVAIGIMSPLGSSALPVSPGMDVANHVGGVVEAANALAEGQFPVRVAPRQNNGLRYPVFQFYGNVPFTAAGFLYRAGGVDAYTALKWVTISALVLAGFFMYLATRFVTGHEVGAQLAGAVFLTAPYMLTDIHARFAFPEVISFALLPVVLHAVLLVSRSSRWTWIGWSAITWATLALSHSITYLYGSMFFAPLVFWPIASASTFFTRVVRLAGAYFLGLGIVAWYVAPQRLLLSDLGLQDISKAHPVVEASWLAPLRVLVAPTLVLPKPLPLFENPRFGLQIGWPILGAAALTVYFLATHSDGAFRRSLRRLLTLFAVAVLLAWTPFDFWRYLPKLLTFVQFPYRLLMFASLWGAVLAGIAAARALGNRAAPHHAVVGILLLGALAAPYLGPHQQAADLSVESESAWPDMGRGGGNQLFLLTGSALQRIPGATLPIVNVSAPMEMHGSTASAHVQLGAPATVRLPVLFYPSVLEVTDNGQVAPYTHIDEVLAVPLRKGAHEVRVRFVGLKWANWVSGLAVLTALLPLASGAFVRLQQMWRRMAGTRLGLAATVLGVAAILLLTQAMMAIESGPVVTAILASSYYDEEHRPEWAFDRNGTTSWAAKGSDAAWLRLNANRAARLRWIGLECRRTSFLECWKTVRLRLYRAGSVVLDKTFTLDEAGREPREILDAANQVTDQVEMMFSQPVTTDLDGHALSPALLNPGYAEIVLGWNTGLLSAKTAH